MFFIRRIHSHSSNTLVLKAHWKMPTWPTHSVEPPPALTLGRLRLDPWGSWLAARCRRHQWFPFWTCRHHITVGFDITCWTCSELPHTQWRRWSVRHEGFGAFQNLQLFSPSSLLFTQLLQTNWNRPSQHSSQAAMHLRLHHHLCTVPSHDLIRALIYAKNLGPRRSLDYFS
jgi:hypothetical protein